MINFGQDRNSMALAQQSARIPQGWLRAILLLIVYLLVTLGAGYFIRSLELWVTVSFITAVALVYLFRNYIDGKSFSSIGLNKQRILQDSVAGLSLGSLLVCTGTLMIYFSDGIEWVDFTFDIGSLVGSAMVLLMVAAAEELVFRRYILRNLMKSFNKWISLFISALLFTLVHVSNPQVPAIALLSTFAGGMLLGITFIHTRNLWFPVFFHFSWNFLQGPVLGFRISGLEFSSILVMQTKGNVAISGGNYGFEGSLFSCLLLVFAGIVWGYFERKRQQSGYIIKY